MRILHTCRRGDIAPKLKLNQPTNPKEDYMETLSPQQHGIFAIRRIKQEQLIKGVPMKLLADLEQQSYVIPKEEWHCISRPNTMPTIPSYNIQYIENQYLSTGNSGKTTKYICKAIVSILFIISCFILLFWRVVSVNDIIVILQSLIMLVLTLRC